MGTALSATPQMVRDRLSKFRPSHRVFRGYDIYYAYEPIDLSPGDCWPLSHFPMQGHEKDLAVLQSVYDRVEPCWFTEE